MFPGVRISTVSQCRPIGEGFARNASARGKAKYYATIEPRASSLDQVEKTRTIKSVMREVEYEVESAALSLGKEPGRREELELVA